MKLKLEDIALLRHQGNFDERNCVKNHSIQPIYATNIQDQVWTVLLKKKDAEHIQDLGLSFSNIEIGYVIYREGWHLLYDIDLSLLLGFKEKSLKLP